MINNLNKNVDADNMRRAVSNQPGKRHGDQTVVSVNIWRLRDAGFSSVWFLQDAGETRESLLCWGGGEKGNIK